MTREEAIKRLEWLEMVAECVDSVTIGSKCTEDWEAYNMAIAALREQPQWISVEERLPEVGQMVLVYCRSQMYKKHVTVSTYTADYSYTRRCYWSRRIKNVAHWMPLPEPPKEEV